ncbi:threonine/serine dehydratase [Magnetospira sp. QH-2]|uniref:threonine ammonia-lyase n=1 Tax=Magnetospira sp. (strain QH-2) TaxID=1288970 RepID=UPI0003E8186F|nr:threonine/serine dehydratase [Magnetospira sp. QH-2]CCQ73473.1 Putative threonine dehydratase [Magnetospira sp. QH-2]
MTSSSPFELPEYQDVVAAGHRLRGHAVETPLLEDPLLNDQLGGRLLIKAEPLQRTGSFKFRGAYNCLCRLDADSRDWGVVAYSSGNHAQGVAYAARLLGIHATIVMPADAPALKIEATQAYGAEVVLYDRINESREAIAQGIADEKGATLIRPFDDPRIIAGQGTVGLEIASQTDDLGLAPDRVAVPCSGGGLIAGCALALSELYPECSLFAVEPKGHDDTLHSLATGQITANEPGVRSFCDALLVDKPGDLTFGINRCLLAGGLAVSDQETAEAMVTAFNRFKLVVEPGGAVALAAVLSGKLEVAGTTTVVVCSGGNVDPEVFQKVLDENA